ncbi:host cell division inhibitor Icd-like protein [Serratia marcescens]|uniref:host cell division inhibitor Icd-like protein n=1 Tax=Serratia marcescens TaxID=615 RepID=UPI0013EE8319|nr:host cell division inhibitor Icd-like protein [Serratia marcescens]
MSNHTTPIAGRNTHIQQHAQSHQRFVFIFAAIRRNSTEIAPEMRHVSAFSEREARKALASDFILLFAGRLPIHALNQSANKPAMSTRLEAERDDQ